MDMPNQNLPHPLDQEKYDRIQQAAEQFRSAIELMSEPNIKVIINWQIIQGGGTGFVSVNGGWCATPASWSLVEAHHAQMGIIESTIRMFPAGPFFTK